MRYKDGEILLTEKERETLSMVTMTDIEESVDFDSFIEGLVKFKDEVKEVKNIHQSLSDRTERDDVIVDISSSMIRILDDYISQGIQSAQEAASSTLVH